VNEVKYLSYIPGFKLKVIEYTEKLCNREADREFTTSEFSVCYWRKLKDALLQTTNKSRKAFLGLKSGKFPELEGEVLEYVGGFRNNGVGFSH
jgi:hypothetical protein